LTVAVYVAEASRLDRSTRSSADVYVDGYGRRQTADGRRQTADGRRQTADGATLADTHRRPSTVDRRPSPSTVAVYVAE
jgi:hypothetical protein